MWGGPRLSLAAMSCSVRKRDEKRKEKKEKSDEETAALSVNVGFKTLVDMEIQRTGQLALTYLMMYLNSTKKVEEKMAKKK